MNVFSVLKFHNSFPSITEKHLITLSKSIVINLSDCTATLELKGEILSVFQINSPFSKFIEKILDNKVSGTKVDSFEGDLMIFKGNKSIHQVTAVEEGERILVTFNYNEAKGIPLSEQSRKTFFGRIK